MKKNRGLFISHADEYAGAPKALFNILKFITKEYPINIDVQVNDFKNHGVFESLKENNKLINIVYKTKSRYRILRILKHRAFFIIKKIYFLNLIIKYNNFYDFIFFNSLSFSQLEFNLNKINVPKYLYLHEGTIGLVTVLRNNYSVFNNFDVIFVPSAQVLDDLIQHGIDNSKITVLQLFLDQDEISSVSSNFSSKDETLVVGNLANLNLIKGTEYFLATAKLYVELYPNDNILFRWKGYLKDSFYLALLKYEIANSGLNEVVFLEEKSKEKELFFSTIDVFLMTSKQETFGYVILEAANYSKPSIAFKKCIGASLFIDSYGGFTADYLSVKQLVLFLKEYYENRDLLKLHGAQANQLLNERYILNDRLRIELKSKFDFMFL